MRIKILYIRSMLSVTELVIAESNLVIMYYVLQPCLYILYSHTFCGRALKNTEFEELLQFYVDISQSILILQGRHNML